MTASEPRAAPEPVALARFLDRAFGGSPGIASEFPTLTAVDNRERSWVLETRLGIAAHAAWRPVVLRSDSRRIRVAGIGLVATDPGQRGRGFAARLVEHCIACARREGAELAFLFGEHTALYARLGFARAGRERITRIAPDPALKPDDRIRAGGPLDAARLLPLLERQPLGVERSASDFGRMLGVARTALWVLEGPAGPLAYCVEGRGRDLHGVVHEWAGAPEAVSALLRGVTAAAGEPLWVLSPESLAPPVAGEHVLGALALFRVLEASALGTSDARELLGDPRRPARLPVYVWGLDSL
jgi:predicted N-acetyltransferase YhbS